MYSHANGIVCSDYSCAKHAHYFSGSFIWHVHIFCCILDIVVCLPLFYVNLHFANCISAIPVAQLSTLFTSVLLTISSGVEKW